MSDTIPAAGRTEGPGRNVVVVGSTSAIGLAIVASFLHAGDRVVGVSLTASDSLCEHLVADCSDPAQVERAFHGILEMLIHEFPLCPGKSGTLPGRGRTTAQHEHVTHDGTMHDSPCFAW